MQIGRSLGSDSLGILFVVVVQSTICLSVYASVIALQIRLLLPRALSLGTTAFFALCPIWASYAQAIEKDTLFAAFFCLFSLALFNILRNRSDPRLIDSRTWLALAFSSVMVCIFRNNGLWAILPTFILLVIALRPLRRKILLSLGSGILLSISLIFVCLPLIGIPKGSSGEALSIPFQQTARYLTEYPNDVTPDQMAKINNVLAGDNLAALYNPELSDPVKGTFKSDATTEDLLAYGTVWLEMLAQHPDSYIQATLNNIFGYLYPSGVFDDHVDTYFFATNTSPTINTGYFDTNYCFNSTERIREIVVDASYVLERVPVLGLTVSCAMYVWIFLILLGYAFSRRNALALLLSIPSAITVLICFASPVNGCIRYLLPVMATLPIIAMACLMHKDRRNEEESQENTPPNMQASAQRFVRSIVKTKAIPIENPPGKRTEGNGET